jgi:Skp family chaperone for outer membrane proteins
MKKMIKTILIVFSLYCLNINAIADIPYYLDFKYILNESTAGKKAQNALKSKLDKGFKNLKEKEKKLQDEEKKIIEQKKLIKPEEYKSKVNNLRTSVSNLQKERNKLLQDVSSQRSKAKSELLKNLNPIIKEYMQEKKIRMVVDKKSLLLADENLDITKEILGRLNKKLKSINIK